MPTVYFALDELFSVALDELFSVASAFWVSPALEPQAVMLSARTAATERERNFFIFFIIISS